MKRKKAEAKTTSKSNRSRRKLAAKTSNDLSAESAALMLQQFKTSVKKVIAKLPELNLSPTLVKQLRKSYQRSEKIIAELALELKDTGGHRN
jgi:hypothetical protein